MDENRNQLMEGQILEERQDFIVCKSPNNNKSLKCEKDSIAGAVSQRACVYCGARVVLNPITDAFHIVHGPIGCASYTWDIRGSLSSGEDTYRNSFSTDLRENDIIFGGENKLAGAIDEIVQNYSAKLIFVYSTCVVGVIGDDIEAICKSAEKKYAIKVIPVLSSGFAGNKAMGYKAACRALMKLMDFRYDLDLKEEIITKSKSQFGVNFLGDFNLAGEMWIINNYLNKIGVKILTGFTGDSKFKDILKAPFADINIVQCAGSMTYLAKMMEEKFKIPYLKVSFFGIDDIRESLLRIAEATGIKEIIERTHDLLFIEELKIMSKLNYYRKRLTGKKAAIYVGGGFKAISLIRQFNDLGMQTVMVGTQTGKKDEYEVINKIVAKGTVILDDTNPTELENFIKEKGADILVGGVKERPLAYKLGIAFCDHNHERKHPLCGFEGAINFAKEIDQSINSPVWTYCNSL